ncbi:LysR family transcriptional regulator [Sphingopyxis panaciterrae]
MTGWLGVDEVVAVADTGSFVGAARRLGSSTSHVSRAVAKLEQRAGVQLFVRTTRAVVLTDTGRHLIEQFRRIVADRDDALAMVDLQREPQGPLRITCSTALGERFVAPIVQAFAQSFPRVAVDLHLTNRIVDLVSEGYDLAVRTGALVDSRLIRTQVATRRLLLCAAPSYLDRRGRPGNIAALASHDCLVGTASNWQFFERDKLRTIRPPARWRCNNGTAVARAAVDGMGICQLPEFYVSEDICSGKLAPLLGEVAPPEEPVWAVYPERRHLLPKVRALIDRLQSDLGSRIAQSGAAGSSAV